ncbi:MAG: DUF3971 domain-containing protein [Alphaproteobacteria bacterium]|nr:DUF3971 domain-containing protein [Alphaproteobacteria bacterium]
MSKRLLKASLPHLNWLTSAILVVAIFAMLLGSLFAMRMAKGPMSLERIKPRIEAALSDPEKNYHVTIGQLYLTWPEITAPLLLDLEGVKIHQDQNKTPLLSIENANLGLSALHLLQGKLLPSLIIIEAPVIDLAREHKNPNLSKAEPKTSEMGPHLPIGEQIAEKKEEIKDVKKILARYLGYITNPKYRDITPLSALKKINIKGAIIKDSSQINKTPPNKTTANETRTSETASAYLAVMDVSLSKHDVGVEGDLLIDLPGTKGEKSFIKSSLLYRNLQEDITFTAEMKDINPARVKSFLPPESFLAAQDFKTSGTFKLALDKKLTPQMASFDLSIPKGDVHLEDIYESPLQLNNIALLAHYRAEEKLLDITKLQAGIDGIMFEGSAPLSFKGGFKNISSDVTLKIDTAPLDKIAILFPKSHLESEAGRWLTQKISNGRFHDASLTTKLIINDGDITMNDTKAEFAIEDVTVKYSDTLMPVKNVIGRGIFENDTLIITGEQGNIGNVKGRDITVKIADISVAGGGMAYVDLNASGPLATVLEYIADEPISIKNELPFAPKDVKGHIDFKLDLEFPTLKDLPKDRVIVKIDGKTRDIYLPNIVRELALSGGPYDLSFADGLINLKGSGAIDSRPITLNWKQYFYPKGKEFDMKLAAQLTTDNDLRKVFDIGLEDYISGPLPIDLNYVEKGNRTVLNVTGDIAPTILRVESFDYYKPSNVAGDLSFKAFLSDDEINEIDKLQVKTKDFQIAGGRILFKKFPDGVVDIAKGQIESFTIGQTNLSAGFEVENNKTLKISATGPVFDLNPFMKVKRQNPEWENPRDKKSSAQPMKISLNVNQILAHEGETVGKSQLYIETDKSNDLTRLEVDAKIGEGDMYLRFRPEENSGQRTFHMESSDAGYTLKSFGLYDKIRGGSMVIYGRPRWGDNNEGDLFGKARLSNFRVKGAPALAKLLSGMSFQGAENLLSNDGVGFSRLESDFEWQFREGGNLLLLKEGRTSGSSLGLTFEGAFDQGKNTTDISGTIIPVSGINKAVGQIPVIGDLLTGGDALIAATYKISGPAQNPDVTVNPLSVLAPGFLRKIFFEGEISGNSPPPSPPKNTN